MGDTETIDGEQATCRGPNHGQKWPPWRIQNTRAKSDKVRDDPRELPDTNELHEATHS
jgi:hypothetical protein